MDSRRKLDRLFRLAAQQTRDYALFLLDARGHVVTWNTGAQLIKGYAPQDIIGRHFSVFYPEEAVRTGWPAYELEMATKEGRFEDEGWRLRKDGTRFWASVIITALRDTNGELLGFSKITRDLTDRMLEQEALRQSEERFRLMVEGVVDYAIYMLDPTGIVTSWNMGAQRITGYTRDEIVGQHFSKFYTEEGRRARLPEAELATANATGRAQDEAWRVRKNGELFWARVVVTALHDEQGQLRGFAKVTQDLTQRRHLEDLQKAAASVNEFIATLAHELRNPLAPIRNAAQAMAQLAPNDPTRERMRAMIERQSASLTRIVDDLLDITRITRGNFAIERTLVDLAEVVRDAVEAAAPAIESRQHSLEISVPARTMMVIGDAHRLAQIVVNLLNNAARYTAPGGRIGVFGETREGSAVLRIVDNGQGIAPELIGRIFDMFVQGRNQLERVAGGLGIGLALARNIAELHGGTIEARSEGQGRGAEFVVRIPLADHAAQSVARTVASPETSAPVQMPKRVLVVDDNADAAMALDLLVRSLGHETRVANDGARAIEMAAEFHPQVVLLDIGMPGINGYEVAKQIRAANAHRPVRIVAVTGWGQENDRQRSLEAGFDVHLVKPVTPDQISLLMEQANGATFH